MGIGIFDNEVVPRLRELVKVLENPHNVNVYVLSEQPGMRKSLKYEPQICELCVENIECGKECVWSNAGPHHTAVKCLRQSKMQNRD